MLSRVLLALEQRVQVKSYLVVTKLYNIFDADYHHAKIHNCSSRLPFHKPVQTQLNQLRHKYTKKSSKQDEDSESEDEEEFKDERDSKVVKAKVNSLRADLLLKSGLNLARNKIEVSFYESKIRINGKKPMKKSVQLNVGDEVDVIRGFSSSNPNILVVARIIILSANARDEGYTVLLRRYKSLLIENYESADLYKASE